jgi:hypothetical protein
MTDTFKLSLDDVEAWKAGGVILNAGTHPIRVVDEEVKLDGDHPVVLVTLEAIGGEEKGGEIRDWIHVTERTLGRIAQIYEAFGVEVPAGEFEWIPLKGKQSKAIVRNVPGRDDPSKTFSEVKAYLPLSSEDAVASAVEEAFDAKPVKDDKDIPF